jgi:hypothetical protein
MPFKFKPPSVYEQTEYHVGNAKFKYRWEAEDHQRFLHFKALLDDAIARSPMDRLKESDYLAKVIWDRKEDFRVLFETVPPPTMGVVMGPVEEEVS